MRSQEAVLSRMADLREEAQDDDLPDVVSKSLQAQAEILEWVVKGDRLPDEYFIEGKLKNSGEFFEKVVIAGVDSDGRVYPASSCEETGEFVLARRPTPQEWEDQKQKK